ncbi:MAG TPA: hypothetical protein VF131_13235 [Blastocatellia bacterium]|nr:hypothetical protein [Blastocatellia bacterium]
MIDIPKPEIPRPEVPKLDIQAPDLQAPDLPLPDKQSPPAVVESLKKVAEKASKAAQKLMSDKPPAPIELGGVADKIPTKGGAVVVSPPPVPALPAGLELPKIQ